MDPFELLSKSKYRREKKARNKELSPNQQKDLLMKDLSAKDLENFREKSRAFCELVKISLDKLQYEKLPDNSRL